MERYQANQCYETQTTVVTTIALKLWRKRFMSATVDMAQHLALGKVSKHAQLQTTTRASSMHNCSLSSWHSLKTRTAAAFYFSKVPNYAQLQTNTSAAFKNMHKCNLLGQQDPICCTVAALHLRTVLNMHSSSLCS